MFWSQGNARTSPETQLESAALVREVDTAGSVARSNQGRSKWPCGAPATRAGKRGVARQPGCVTAVCTGGHAGRALQPTCWSIAREVLQVTAK